MPQGCCKGQNCSCQVATEGRLSVDGSGQPGDPFVFSLEAEFESAANETFNTIASGTGYVADPWVIETQFAATAKLDQIPDVNAPTPTNGQVLSWNSATAKWVSAAPTVAPTGAVQHGASLAGDGSIGAPLSVVTDGSRLVGGFSTGVGLTDQGLSSVVQHFADAAARSAGIPVPTVNALTMLDTDPGILWYWSGLAWSLLPNQTDWVATGGQFLNLSGAYVDNAPVAVMTLQLNATTDASGVFEVLSAVDLTGRSGVLAVNLQETGAVAWKAMVDTLGSTVVATAYRLTDGSVMAGTPVTAMVQAILY